MVCICIPAIKPLLNSWFPKYFGSSGSNPNPVSFHLSDTEATSEGEGARQNSFLRKIGSVISTLKNGKSRGSKGSSRTDVEVGAETPWRDSKTAATMKMETGSDGMGWEPKNEAIMLSETDTSTKV
jgi:hypothetical protein